MRVSTNQNDELSLTGEIPHALSKHQIPGSKVRASTNGFGQLLIQELDSPAGRMYYTIHRIEKKVTLKIHEDEPVLTMYVCLQNDRHMQTEGLGAMHLKEGQYNLFYSPGHTVTMNLEPGREYIGVSLRYTMPVLEEMCPYFPKMAAFLERVRDGGPAQLLEENCYVTREIQDTVFKIINAPKEAQPYNVYFDLLLRTLLFHLLLQSVQRQPRSGYSHYEISGIHEAREMISRNLKYHYRIPEIAQKVGINEFKLKNGFREVFGDGLYEYLLTERMREARNLLHEAGKNIKEIAAMTGYKSVNSFIKAFKRKFNQTPGEFRSQEKEARAASRSLQNSI